MEKCASFKTASRNCSLTLYIDGTFLNLFPFNNVTQSGQLEFHRKFLDTLQSPGKLQEYMEATVTPAVLENPHKRIKQIEMEQLDRTIHKTILKNWDRYDEHEVSGLGTLVP